MSRLAEMIKAGILGIIAKRTRKMLRYFQMGPINVMEKREPTLKEALNFHRL